jgi:hypothetical protein
MHDRRVVAFLNWKDLISAAVPEITNDRFALRA